MVFKLTNDSLSKMEGLPPAISNAQKYPEIVEVKNYTVQAVNELLEKEILRYVYTSDNERIDLAENEYAFKFFKRFIECENWELIEMSKNNVAMIIDDSITYNWSEYKNAKLVRKHYIAIVPKASVTKQKPTWLDAYHKVDQQTHREYIKESDLDEEQIYEWAKITDMSLMEITSLSWLESEKEQLDFLKKYFWEWEFDFENISSMYDQAISIFKERSTFLEKSASFRGFEGKRFETQADILQFLEKASDSTNNRRLRTIYCTLLKYVYLLNEYEKSPAYKFLSGLETGWEQKKIAFIREMYNLDDDTEISRDPRWVYRFLHEVAGVPVIITFRIKSIKSIVTKSLWKWKYLNIDNFHDLIAASYYIPKEYSSSNIEIMKEVDKNFLSHSWYLDNKGFITKDMVTELESGNQYNKKYLKAFENKWTSGSGDPNYVDAKFTWKYILPSWDSEVSIGYESKFYNGIPEEDVNEVWMKFHPVYDYFSKYFEAETNRQPFITAENLQDRIGGLYDVLWNMNLQWKYNKQRIDVLREIYDELNFKAHKTWFPDNESGWKLKNFYENTIAEMIFKKLVSDDKYEIKRARVWGKMCFITKYNREQLLAWGRWYEFKEAA